MSENYQFVIYIRRIYPNLLNPGEQEERTFWLKEEDQQYTYTHIKVRMGIFRPIVKFI